MNKSKEIVKSLCLWLLIDTVLTFLINKLKTNGFKIRPTIRNLKCLLQINFLPVFLPLLLLLTFKLNQSCTFNFKGSIMLLSQIVLLLLGNPKR